jgi:hypothetical protein
MDFVFSSGQGPNVMIINMTTVASRETHYIDRTLESLFQSDGRDIPLNLILGSCDASHVERYRHVATLVAWDEAAESQAGSRRRNCNVNAIRALKYGDDDYCLCCEDDIIFDPDWFSQLMLTVAEIDREDYVLNLGQGCDQSPSKRYATHTQSFLCGAQGIFYPSKRLRIRIAKYVQENINGSTNDDLVGRFAKRFAALYNTTPTLIYHIGQVSCFHSPDRPAEPEQQERSQAQDTEMSSAPNVDVDRRADHTAAPSVTTIAEMRRDDVSRRVTSEIVIALLRASLGTGPLPDATRVAECDWVRFALLARHHGIGPILYRALHERAASVPAAWLQKFKAQYVTNAFHNRLARESIDEIGAVLSSEQIPVILMKGAALLRTLYDDQGLRTLCDVDLLVDERDVERADMQLQAWGMKLPVSEEVGSRCHYSLVYCWQEPRTIPVELHWRIFERYRPYVFDLDAVRAQARPLPGMPPNVLVMAPEHELTHPCLHLDRHAITYRSLIGRKDWCDLLLLPQGSGRLLWLYDIALYLQRRCDLIDWDSFVDTARRWAIDGRLYATLEMSRRALGVGPPPEVLQALKRGRPQLVERIAHSVVLASRRANEAQRNASGYIPQPHWLMRLSDPIVTFAHTWISVFPPRAYLHARYATPNSSRWLQGAHFREVGPELWAETRDRLSSATAARSDRRPR